MIHFQVKVSHHSQEQDVVDQSHQEKLQDFIPFSSQKIIRHNLDEVPLMADIPESFSKCMSHSNHPEIRKSIWHVILLLAYLRSADEKQLIHLHTTKEHDGFLNHLVTYHKHNHQFCPRRGFIEMFSTTSVTGSKFLQQDLMADEPSLSRIQNHYNKMILGNT